MKRLDRKTDSRFETIEVHVLNLFSSSAFSGRFSFPDNEWAAVSEEAKDLIRGLLVKAAPKRLSAEAVLNHPWIKVADDEDDDIDCVDGSPAKEKREQRRRALKTPGNIRRNQSARELSHFAESAMAVKRVILQHFSMRYDYMTKERPNIYQPAKTAGAVNGTNGCRELENSILSSDDSNTLSSSNDDEQCSPTSIISSASSGNLVAVATKPPIYSGEIGKMTPPISMKNNVSALNSISEIKYSLPDLKQQQKPHNIDDDIDDRENWRHRSNNSADICMLKYNNNNNGNNNNFVNKSRRCYNNSYNIRQYHRSNNNSNNNTVAHNLNNKIKNQSWREENSQSITLQHPQRQYRQRQQHPPSQQQSSFKKNVKNNFKSNIINENISNNNSNTNKYVKFSIGDDDEDYYYSRTAKFNIYNHANSNNLYIQPNYSSSYEADDDLPIGLSPPTESLLMQRRLKQSLLSSSSSVPSMIVAAATEPQITSVN